jgi:glycosyltransferase involved in cell wall biosynthesis
LIFFINPYGTINSNSISSVIYGNIHCLETRAIVVGYNFDNFSDKCFINLFETNSITYKLFDFLFNLIPYRVKNIYLKNKFGTTRFDFIFYLINLNNYFKKYLKKNDSIILHAYPGILKYFQRYRDVANIIMYYHNNNLSYLENEGINFFKQHSDGLIVLNEKPFEELLSNQFYNVWVLNNFVDLSFTISNEYKKPDYFYSGRLVRDKYIFELCTAFKKVYSGSISSKLYIAGDFYDKDYENKVRSSFKNELNIVFLGKLSKKRLYQQQSLAKYTLLISNSEGSPLSLLEGAALGNKLIASNILGCKEIIDSFGGFLINNENIVSNLVSLFFQLNEGDYSSYIYPNSVLIQKFTKFEHCKRLNYIINYLQLPKNE